MNEVEKYNPFQRFGDHDDYDISECTFTKYTCAWAKNTLKNEPIGAVLRITGQPCGKTEFFIKTEESEIEFYVKTSNKHKELREKLKH